MKIALLAGFLISATLMLGCSKEPPQTAATGSGPDNAVTRYAENLQRSEDRAQETAKKANALIAKQQDQINQAQGQQGNNP